MMGFVSYKLLTESAQMPFKAHRTDAGFDLFADEDAWVFAKERQTIKTGISFDMPENMAGLIWPRSGLSVKKGIDILAGVVDSGYRGEIKVCLLNTSSSNVEIEAGDRVAQILFQEVPKFKMISSTELTETEREDKGFGSSGN